MFESVKIGEKHLYDDFDLILKTKSISPPKPKVETVSIPLRDGDLDLSEVLTDDIKFDNREIELSLMYMGDRALWSGVFTNLASYLHGKRMQIIFDDDKNFYYTGRVAIDKWATNRAVADLVIKIDAEPYKRDLISTLQPWEWDTFDFESGIINEVDNITVSGTTTVSLIGRRKRVYPTINVSSAMTLRYNNNSYNLTAGNNTIYDLLLQEGENLLTFVGNGTAKIDYIGGAL